MHGSWGRQKVVGRCFVLLGVVALGWLLAACDRGEPPPTNPLDESRVTGTASPQPTGPAVFPPAPAGTPTPVSPSPTGTPNASGAAWEKAAARGIEAIAGWLGLPQTEFSIGLVEVVAWPDACLGVTRPDVACAQVVTPGERVTVRHRSGVSYEVHLGPREAAAWAAPFESTRRIASVDVATGVVTLQAITGNDELGTRHRVVPGSAAAVLKDLKPGDSARIAVAYPTTPGGMPVIVWLVRAQ